MPALSGIALVDFLSRNELEALLPTLEEEELTVALLASFGDLASALSELGIERQDSERLIKAIESLKAEPTDPNKPHGAAPC